jgi:hypothetical protein
MEPEIGSAIADIAMRSAVAYLRNHDLVADNAALAKCLKAHIRMVLPQAIKDAKDALECGMRDAANCTLAASISLAGIEAAKEAGFPSNLAPI